MTLVILYMNPCCIFPRGRICVYLPFDGECWKFTLWIVQGPHKVRTGGERYYRRLHAESSHTVQVERKQALTWSSLEEGLLWVIASTLTWAPARALTVHLGPAIHVLLVMQRCLQILTNKAEELQLFEGCLIEGLLEHPEEPLDPQVL